MNYPCRVRHDELLHNSGPCGSSRVNNPQCSTPGCDAEAHPDAEGYYCAACNLEIWREELRGAMGVSAAYLRTCGAEFSKFEQIVRAM